MGIQMSKTAQGTATSAAPSKRNRNQDEVLSGTSTVSTMGSMSLPPSPITMESSRNHSQASKKSQIGSSYSQRAAIRRRNDEVLSNLGTNLHRCHSASSSPRWIQEKRTEPVKCPPRSGPAASPPEGDHDSQYLMRMYDSRTWQMYRRITEARKNSNYSYQGSPLDTPTGDAGAMEWETLNHDHSEASDGHEMIFLFDFD